MFDYLIVDKKRDLVIPNDYEYLKSINFNCSGDIDFIETEFVNVKASGESYIDKSIYKVGEDEFEFYINGKRLI